MGHKRRFAASELRQMLEAQGFRIEREHQLNKIGALSWWFGGLFGSKRMSRPALKLWDKTVWFWRRVDGFLPGEGLSLVAVARRTATRLH
jgi:hypothetical protein